jgi:tol-pal system protein YbgF
LPGLGYKQERMRLFLSLVVLLTCACFFPADRGRLLEARVDKLNDENQKLKNDLSEATAQLQETAQRIKAAIAELDSAAKSSGANMGVKVDTAIQEMASLRGQLEASQFKVAELEQKLATNASTTVPTTDSKPVEPKKEEPKKPEDANDFLTLALEKAKAKDHDAARKLLTEFLKRWPRNDGVGEARFALGETYFEEKKCREALYEYGKVIQDHAKTKSAPSAYLRSAECFQDLKMSAESKLALEEVVKQFPKSESAKLAKNKLSDLEKKSPSTKKK